MPGTVNSGNRSGRRGAPLRRRYTLPAPAAIYVKTLTQSRLNRREVSEEELHETLEQIVREHAERLQIEPS